MKSLTTTVLCALALGAGANAQAQTSCGTGGGATICLTATGTPDNIQLTWAADGPVTAVQVYRDTDSDPNGRVRVAQLGGTIRSYTDSGVASARPYWYWVKFTNSAGTFTTNPATAARNCTATEVTPYMNQGGVWTPSSANSVAPWTTIGLGPQAADNGSWSWSGTCGATGSGREQWLTIGTSCTAKVTFTNSCGAQTTKAFPITVSQGMRNISSLEASKTMSPGWNLGNTLEAVEIRPDHLWKWGSTTFKETDWGNPIPTQELMNAVKAAGFKFVRIPASWSQYANRDNIISPLWMNHVKEVVGYARNAGLDVMINIHWDGGWMYNPTYAAQPASNAKLRLFWTQIATAFKDYDDHLLFAAQNETAMPDTWGTPSAEWLDVQNTFNQVFVDAVRDTGGNNAQRYLIAPAYATNIDIADQYFVMPRDSAVNKLFVEVHFYDPYKMALDDKSPTYTWGSGSTDPDGKWATEAWMDGQFQKMNTNFIVKKGTPVILGEYGAISKTDLDPAGTWRRYWAQYVTRSAFQRSLVPVWWDEGGVGNHTGGLINRGTLTQSAPDVISAIVGATK
ncbi:cellulase family glycosylhydrolase [Ideonella sp. YS5]|uniref:glycoside hydrolase family 5 protein n=1 Tax=Ideonella sp. YS5 TaxID=3453714 RepID=UPI003EEE32C4